MGLRANALVVLYEARPASANKVGEWNWPDDGGATYSLFCDVAKMTGLLPMLEHYEAKFEKVAKDIELAGGDGFTVNTEQVAEEAPQPQTPEEWAERYRNIIDHFTAKISEIEAQIAEGAAS